MKSKIIILLFVLVFLSQFGFSQTVFNKNYDNDSLLDYIGAVIQSDDGGYLICGNTYNFSTGFIATLLIKTDCTGDTIWKKVYDLSNTGADSGESILQLYNKNYIVFGYYQDTILLKKDMFLMELDVKGNIDWFNAYGGTENEGGYMVKKTNDNGYILCGYTSSSMSNGGIDIYIVKTDSLGNIDWENNYGGSLDDVAYSIDLTYDNGYIIGGRTYSYGLGEDDLYMVKIDSLGNFKWQQTYGTSGDDYGETIIQTLDKGFAFVGSIENGSGNDDAYIVKTDSLGNFKWDKTYGTFSFGETFKRIIQLPDSSYIVSGGLGNNNPGDFDGWLIKLSPTGDSLWSMSYGNSAYTLGDYFYDICLTSDGGYAMGGQWNRIGPPYQNAWLVKTDSLGCDQPLCNNGCDSCAYINPEIYFPFDTVFLSSPTVQFIDTSDFAQAWHWDFGDSNTDTVKNPIHTYTDSGTYNVMLIAYYSDCSDTVYHTVIVCNDVGIEELYYKDLSIYPNPTNNSLNVVGDNIHSVEIFDITGKLVYTEECKKMHNIIDVKPFNPGLYFIIIQTNDSLFSEKLIIH